MSPVHRAPILNAFKSVRALALLLAMLATPAAAESIGGTHFVVLIDDSGDMRALRNESRQRANLLSVLEQSLYGPMDGRPDGERPVFDPARDHLSVVFFTIHRDVWGSVDRCKTAGRRYSALPSAIFQYEALAPPAVASRDGFVAALDGLLSMGCRARGNQSPIITATTLVLPFLDDHLPPGRRFLRTLLTVVTNDQFITTGSPALELPNLHRNEDDQRTGDLVRDIEEAVDQAEGIAPLLRFGFQRDWSRVSGPFHLQVYEVEPVAPTADALLFHGPQLEIDRVARSATAIELTARRPGQGDLRVAVPESPSAIGGWLWPARLLWRVRGKEGEPWVVGPQTLSPDLRELDLAGCVDGRTEGPCRRTEDGIAISWLELLELPTLSPADPEIEHGAELEFLVELAYVTERYEHMAVRSSPRSLPIEPTPVDVVPATILFGALPLDNRQLADLYRSIDGRSAVGGLVQDQAKDRIMEWRDQQVLRVSLLAALALVALVAAVVYYFIRTAYRRPFDPRLEWQPAAEVAVDFSQHSHSRLLVGTLTIHNQGEVPWFGRLLRHDEQPTREARLHLAPPDLADQGLEVADPSTAVGFLGSGADGELTVSTQQAVSDGKRIYIFLSAESLRDLEAPEDTAADFVAEIGTVLGMEWHHHGGRRRLRDVTTEIHFRLRIRPEAAREPRVTFQPATAPLHFRLDQKIEAGRFVFASRARHRFATPFVGDFALRALCDHVPMAGEPWVLDSPRVELPGGAHREVPVRIYCDDHWVTNPEPSQQEHELHLLGPCHRDSETGPHLCRLLRDPTRAEIELRVTYRGAIWDVFWTEEGVRARDVKTGAILEGDGQSLRFAEPSAYRFSRGSQAPTLLSFELGNTGRSGRGTVRAEVTRRLELEDNAAGLLHTVGEPSELLQLWDRDMPVGEPASTAHVLEVAEGQVPERRGVRVDYSEIERIDGASLRAEEVRGVVAFDLLVVDDQGDTKTRQVELSVGMELEQLPGLNWLCVDFGTSAIAAAVGHPDDPTAFKMIDLQTVPLHGNKHFASEQPANPEASTPFLPSWIVCDGDLRFDESHSGNGWPAGFPLHNPTSLDLRAPSFVGLPALQRHFESRPGRVIFSLKQWLGKYSPTVRLGDAVTFEASGRKQQRELLPLDDLLEASFGALAEAYLKREPHLRADQIVLCHPNTFTPRHRERFRKVVTRALQRRLGIAAPKHIQLVSESDAVAYHYCAQSMRGAPRSGSERILVYDFGAGTLDISIIRVDWRSDRFAPRSWTVESRLGIPVAGNHFDELLARIIDATLRVDAVIDDTGMAYRFPLVNDRVSNGEQKEYRQRVLGTWQAIRQAKHSWDGGAFLVRVGGLAGGGGVLRVDSNLSGVLAKTPPPSDVTGLFEDTTSDTNSVLLSIPESHIHQDPGVATFVDFVTQTAIHEALRSAGLQAKQIDTLLISGRGALWPGLIDKARAILPAAAKPEMFSDAVDMKETVARGAIALQSLRREIGGDSWQDHSRAQLGILIGRQRLVLESEWQAGTAIDLSTCQEFRLVQVGLSRPDPIRDLAGLARHFYVDLTERPIRRDELWHEDPRLFVEVVDQGSDHLEIRLKNSEGGVLEITPTRGAQASPPPTPPWPVGTFLLDPQPQLD